MSSVELKKDIHWVGALDWPVRDFHGYVTPRGTTYNNYLLMDDEVTLIDTVKYDFADAMMKKIRALVDPSKIKHVVINHIENDHVTSLHKVMEVAPEAIVYMTKKGKRGIDRFYDTSKWKIELVKTGDQINTGKFTLTFLETPMLHWPDSMMTYLGEEKILFSQDAFGQHVATNGRFDDELIETDSMMVLEDAVIEYYANILMPFGALVNKKLDEVAKLGLDIEMIAPDHGVIWRKRPDRVLEMYRAMAEGAARKSVSIIYDTMWKSTELMTAPIADGIRDQGVDVTVMKLRATPMSVAIKEFWKSRGTLIGSPTLNNIVYPSVAEFLTHLRGLRPKNRMVSAFGSYGWSGGAVKEAFEEFNRMGLETVESGIQLMYRPSPDDENECYEFGREFANKVTEYHEKFPKL